MKHRNMWIQASRAGLLLYAMLLMAASLTDLSDQTIETSDKLLHLLAYLAFTSIAYSASRNWRQFLILSALVFGYGLLIEYLQHLTPTRTMSLGDAVANTAGIGLGIVFCQLVERWRRPERPKTKPGNH